MERPDASAAGVSTVGTVDAALRQVLARYCQGVDRIDPDLTLSCFLPAAPVDYVGIYAGPIEGFVDFVMASHRRLRGHFHLIGNVLIDTSLGFVRSETYVTITLWKQAADGVSEVTVRGRYLDEWQADDSGSAAAAGPRWRIARRTHLIDLRTVDGQPDQSVLLRREAELR
jgi:hypothetical protein